MQLIRASLAGRTTLGVGGEATIAECDSLEDIQAALAHVRQSGLPYWVMGEGSNTLAPDGGYAGIVIHPRMNAVSFQQSDVVHAGEPGAVLVAEAGAHWDALVDAAVERGLWGIENLAGIPGSAGAAAVQNIGAYGAELKDVVEWVECFDASDMGAQSAHSRDALKRFARAECGFGYRDSRFKREPQLIVLRIALRLSTPANPRLEYPDFAKARAGVFGTQFTSLETPGEIAAAVRAIRASKFPDLAQEGTAGSFFKNPVISAEAFGALRARYPELPGFPQNSDASAVKVPLAFILDRVLGLKGYRVPGSGARCFEKQPLVLVADRGAHARDVDELARDVAKKVFDATSIIVEREVVSMD